MTAVGLGLSLVLITVRQNAQIRRMAASHNAQLLEQVERFAAQTKVMTAKHNAETAMAEKGS